MSQKPDWFHSAVGVFYWASASARHPPRQPPHKVEAAYRRSSALEKRRLLMQSWTQYCSGEVAGSNVTVIGKRA